jgi:GDP-L-fucose synthase
MSYWVDKRVAVTGGAGFIGSHLVEALRRAQAKEIVVVRSSDHDLTKEEQVVGLLQKTRPDIVIHLAGLVGGIGANKARPAEFFYRNLTMGTFMLHHSWRCGVRRFIAAGAGCGYPEHAPMPLKEESFWDGLPQKESAPYSLAKRLLHIQSIAYYQQYGFVSVVVIPGNVYGPYDNFDLQASHVVPALVRKFVEATEEGAREVTVWGTGRPSRDFVYAGDVADGILLAAECYDHPELVNLSSGVETSVQELVETIRRLTGYPGRAVWDTTRPDGQLRRYFDISKASHDLGFEPRTNLEKGLAQTIAWYKTNRNVARVSV